MRSLGESEESVGWTKIKTRSARKRRGVTRRDAEIARLRRGPDSNIVLGIGRSTSLSEPTRSGAIGHEIHATDHNCMCVLLFFYGKAAYLRSRGVANRFT